MNIALILAGGTGTRAGLSCPKQFYKVNEKPIIVYTMEKFQKAPSVDRIVIVCADEFSSMVMGYKEKYGLEKLCATAKAGESGLESLKNGINTIMYSLEGVEESDYILIHDAVRPFVDVSVIEENIHTAVLHGNAMTAVECVETLVQSDNGVYADHIIPRDGKKRVQTPQTFILKDINNLLETVNIHESNAPSAFALWMAHGNPIYCSRGSEKNIKITFPEDIEYFKSMFDN